MKKTSLYRAGYPALLLANPKSLARRPPYGRLSDPPIIYHSGTNFVKYGFALTEGSDVYPYYLDKFPNSNCMASFGYAQ